MKIAPHLEQISFSADMISSSHYVYHFLAHKYNFHDLNKYLRNVIMSFCHECAVLFENASNYRHLYMYFSINVI